MLSEFKTLKAWSGQRSLEEITIAYYIKTVPRDRFVISNAYHIITLRMTKNSICSVYQL